MKNLGILLSGRGSNFEAIAKNVASGKIQNATIAIVISNREDAGGIARARELGIKTLVLPSKGKAREEHDREVVTALQQHKVDLVCLAGYMRLLSPWFVKTFPPAHVEHSSVLATGCSGTRSAGTGICLWGEGRRLHRTFCGRGTGPWADHVSKGRSCSRYRR